MKSKVAAYHCMLLYRAKNPLKGKLGIMLTSDEEGPAEDGVKKVVEELKSRGIKQIGAL